MAQLSNPDAPLVAVVTPVFNGASFIEGCVRSVRAQEHERWVHLVIDNASTDDTAGIVSRLAEDETRLRLLRFEEHLPMLGSWNRATLQVPPHADYIKHLSGDDRMTPDCLRRMVAAAEADPDVAMVSARWREGIRVAPMRPVPDPYRLPGREAMRRYLLGGPDVFGTPSACLYRRSALAGLEALYPPEPWPPGHPEGEPGPSTDKIGYADILDRGAFVFLPEVLTYDHVREGAQSGFAEHMRVQVPGDLDALLIIGHRYLTRPELEGRVRALAARYSRSLGKATLLGRPFREPEFAVLHHHVLEHLAERMRQDGFSSARALLAPHRAVFRVARARARARSGDPAGR